MCGRFIIIMMRHDDSSDNLAGEIKEVLHRYNCVHIWESQHVVNKNIFLRHLRERMITVSNTKWLNILCGSDRYNIYRMLKIIRYKESYLNVIDCITNRKTLSSILIHRFIFTTNAQSVCPLCNERE